MKKLRDWWKCYQGWRLNCYADGLLKEAEHHKNAAKMHSAAASMFWDKASEARAKARELLPGYEPCPMCEDGECSVHPSSHQRYMET